MQSLRDATFSKLNYELFCDNVIFLFARHNYFLPSQAIHFPLL